jgi:hypothetical protein
MKKGCVYFFLAAVIIVGGCYSENKPVPPTLSNVNVTTSCSPAAKFPAGSGYAFVTLASDEGRGDAADQIDRRIQKALSDELKQKGYKPGEYANINFFVAYTFGLQQQIEVLVGKSKVQGNEWISMVTTAQNYVNGALLVQVIDAKSMEPVWLGVVDADIRLVSVSERAKQERVRYAVRELLKAFPQK